MKPVKASKMPETAYCCSILCDLPAHQVLYKAYSQVSSQTHLLMESQNQMWNSKASDLLIEYKRPWKLFSLFCGISLLVVGSFYYQAPDWDIPISFIMALLTYLTASWSMQVILERQWKNVPLMLFYTWFTVDGSYWLYWSFKNPVALELMREANFFASLSLYGICGLVWYYKGSLRQLLLEVWSFLKAETVN